MATKITRRLFLAGTLGILATSSTPKLHANQPTDTKVLQHLKGAFKDADFCKNIRNLSTNTSSLLALESVIERLGRHSILSSTPSELHWKVAEASQQDFKRGKVASVQGWILSHTEINICYCVAI